MYTNAPGKCEAPTVEAAGDSDHMAVIFTKFSRELRVKPQTIKKRNYKNFCAEDFLKEINESRLNDEITNIDNID